MQMASHASKLTISKSSHEAGNKFVEVAHSALKRTHYTQLARIDCTCNNGAITLRGRVTSFHLKQLAQHAVLSALPDAQLDNQIEVTCSSAK